MTRHVEKIFTEEAAHEFARHWMAGWNSHSLDEIMSHYAGNLSA
jgi:hypothetical protein